MVPETKGSIFKTEVTIRTDPKPVNDFFFLCLIRKKTYGKKSHKRYCDRGQRQGNPDRAKDQSDCTIPYHARFRENKRLRFPSTWDFFDENCLKSVCKVDCVTFQGRQLIGCLYVM